MKIEDNCKVKVHYTGTLEDGSKFDSSEGKEPLEFVTGKGMMIPGFEKAIQGMIEGDETEVKLLPGEAYGDPNPALIQEVPKKGLPEGMKVEKGTMLMLKAPTGQQLPAKVVDVMDETFKIDMNHPLAGKTLNFKIKIEEVKEAPAEAAAPVVEEAPETSEPTTEETKSEEVKEEKTE